MVEDTSREGTLEDLDFGPSVRLTGVVSPGPVTTREQRSRSFDGLAKCGLELI